MRPPSAGHLVRGSGVAIKTMYRHLLLETGEVVLREYNAYKDAILLGSMEVEFSDFVEEDRKVELLGGAVAEWEAKFNEMGERLNKMKGNLDDLLCKERTDGK